MLIKKGKTNGLYYEDSGKGPVVVLLHGYLESHEIWKGLSEKLCTHFRVICIDLPGHGLTVINQDEKSPNSFVEVADGIIHLLENLSITKSTLVGYSLGGRVALYLYLNYGDLFDCLILESSSIVILTSVWYQDFLSCLK